MVTAIDFGDARATFWACPHFALLLQLLELLISALVLLAPLHTHLCMKCRIGKVCSREVLEPLQVAGYPEKHTMGLSAPDPLLRGPCAPSTIPL